MTFMDQNLSSSCLHYITPPPPPPPAPRAHLALRYTWALRSAVSRFTTTDRGGTRSNALCIASPTSTNSSPDSEGVAGERGSLRSSGSRMARVLKANQSAYIHVYSLCGSINDPVSFPSNARRWGFGESGNETTIYYMAPRSHVHVYATPYHNTTQRHLGVMLYNTIIQA